MKNLRKILAIALAIVMIFGSVSALAYDTFGDGQKRSMIYEFKFFDEDGNETTKVYPGQKITAKLYVGTDFVAGTHNFFILFDKSVLTPVVPEGKNMTDMITLNSYNSTLRTGEYYCCLDGTENPGKRLVNLGYIPADTYDTYGSIYVDGNDGYADTLDIDQWLYSWDFTVNSTVTGSDVATMFIPYGARKTTDSSTYDACTVIARIADDTKAGQSYAATATSAKDPTQWAEDFSIEAVYDQDVVNLGTSQGDANAASLAMVTYDGDVYNTSYLTLAPDQEVTWTLGTKVDKTENLPYGDAYSDHEYTPTVPYGYTFDGWNTNADGAIIDDNGNTTVQLKSDTATNNVTGTLTPEEVAVTFWPPYQAYDYNSEDDDIYNASAAGWTNAIEDKTNPIYDRRGNITGYNTETNKTRTAYINYNDIVATESSWGEIDAPEGYYFAGWAVYTGADSGDFYTPSKADVIANTNLTKENYSGLYVDSDGYYNLDLVAVVLPNPSATLTTTVYVDRVKDDTLSGDYTGTIDIGDVLTAADVYTVPVGYTLDADTTAASITIAEGENNYDIFLTKNEYSVVYSATQPDGTAYTSAAQTKTVGDAITAPTDADVAGYDLTWSSNDATLTEALIGTADATNTITITGTYTAKDYTQEWKVTGIDGTTVTTVKTLTDAHVGDALTAPEVAEIAGYTFAWANIPADNKQPASSLTINGSYTGKTYAVTFTGADTTTDFTVGTDDYSAPAEPAKPGYTPTGWYTADGTKITDLAGVIANADADNNLTLTPGYDKITYSVVWTYTDTLGAAQTTTPVSVVIGDAVTDPEKPVTAGYDFAWDAHDATLTEALIGTADDTNTITINGTYTGKTYAVTFDYDDDQTEDVTDNWTVGTDTFTAPENPEKLGYTFNYWKTEDGTKVDDLAGVIAKADSSNALTLVPDYTVIDYTVVFSATKPDGTTYTADPQTVQVDGAITYPAEAATKVTGYNFAWATSVTTLDDTLIDLADDTNTITIGGTYTKITYTITWTISDPENGDVQIHDNNVQIGDSIPSPADDLNSYMNDEAPAGYVFDSWSWDTDGSSPETLTADIITKYATGTDIAVTGSLKLDTLNITYKLDGGEWPDGTITQKSIAVTYGESVSDVEAKLPTGTPTKYGKTFAGWSYEDAEGNTYDGDFGSEGITESLTATALWNDTQYTVKYYLDDAKTDEWSADAPVVLTVDDVINENTPADPDDEKEGYYFTEWKYYDADGNEMTVTTETKMPAENITAVAQWELESYKINFAETGDKAIDAMTVTYGDDVTIPAPTRTGYTFKGWYNGEDAFIVPAADGTYNGAYNVADLGESDEDDTAGITLTAHWEKNSYTITYVYGDTRADKEDTYEFDAAVTVEAAPKRDGYTLENGAWAWTNEEGEEVAAPVNMPAYNLIATANWTINSYDINYYLDDAKTSQWDDTYTKEYNEVINDDVPADPDGSDNAGHYFTGWAYTDEEGNAVTVDETTRMPASDLTAIAQWEVEQYVINFAETGDAAIASMTVTYGEDTTIPAPTKEGYTFDGWYNGEDAFIVPAADGTYSGAYNVADLGESDADNTAEITLTAHWSINSYTITYVYGDERADKVVTYEYNADVIAEAAPVRDGYTLNGGAWAWTKDGAAITAPEKMPASNLVATASWTVETYNIEFNTMGGDTLAAKTVTYGEAAVLPDATREGYKFTGWYTDDTCATAAAVTDASDNVIDLGVNGATVTLYAGWEANEYDVTFDPNYDGAPAPTTAKVAYDSDIKAPEALERDGYEFLGWAATADGEVIAKEADAVLGKQDDTTNKKTFYAQWEAKEVNATFELNYEGAPAATVVGVTFGQDIVYDVKPERTGYSFKGWAATESGDVLESLGKMDNAAGKTFYAQWEANEYDATFDLNYEGAPAAAKLGVTYGEDIVYDVKPERDGYSFKGWAATETGDVLESLGKMDDVNGKTFYAIWDANNCTATFDLNYEGAPAATTNEFKLNSKITAPEMPSREGYEFLGWAATADGEVIAKAEGAELGTMDSTAGKTFYAKWAEADATYTVTVYTMDTDGTYDAGVVSAPIGGTTGATVDALDSVTVPTGFYVDTDMTGTTTGTVKADSTLNINVYLARDKYTVSYELAGGSFTDSTAASAEYYYGAVITAPANPVRTGYAFASWDKEIETTVTANATYTALWNVNVYPVTYYVEGSAVEIDTAAYGTDYTVSEYAFNGSKVTEWAIGSEDGTAVASGATMNITAATKLYAKTIVAADVTYKAIFVVNGEVVSNKAYAEGADIEAPEKVTVPTGYNFVGWDKEVGTMGNEEITFTAILNPTEYAITYYLDEAMTDEWFSTTATVETLINDTTPADPADEKAGYTFVDWHYYSASDTDLANEITVNDGTLMTADNLVAIAEFTPNDYTVNYYLDDEMTSSWDSELTLTVEDIINDNTPADPEDEKTGYEFTEWTYYKVNEDGTLGAEFTVDDTTTMPAYNLVAIAGWSAKTYQATFELNYTDAPAAKSVDVVFDKPITAPDDIDTTRTGYAFKGWAETADAAEALDSLGNMDKEGKTFYAVWTPVNYTVVWTYTDVDGTAKTADEKLDNAIIGDAVNDIAAPTADGYTFAWDAHDATITEAMIETADETNTITLTGSFTAITYTVIYTFEDGSKENVEITVNSDSVAPTQSAEKTGYTLDGWYTADDKKIDSAADVIAAAGTGTEVNVTPRYTAIQYTVVFTAEKPDGSTYSSAAQVVTLDSPAITEPTDAAVANYELTWAPAEHSTLTEALIATADATNKITITGTYTGGPVDTTVIKLMPVEDSTTMIERNGVIETYNDLSGYTKLAYGVKKYTVSGTSTKAFCAGTAYDDVYDNTEALYGVEGGSYLDKGVNDNWYVYGIPAGTALSKLSNYVKISDSDRGYISYENAYRDRVVSTGTIIKVWDNNGTPDDTTDDILVEQFRVVIYGDIDCNGAVNNNDVTLAAKEPTNRTFSKSSSKIPYICRAADIDQNSAINNADATKLTNVVAKKATLSQISGISTAI